MATAENTIQDDPSMALRCWVELDDQRLVSFPAAPYPLLAEASQELLEKVRLRLQDRALRWEEFDEDILVDDAVHARFPRPRSAVV